jgi:hypothetical protein
MTGRHAPPPSRDLDELRQALVSGGLRVGLFITR